MWEADWISVNAADHLTSCSTQDRVHRQQPHQLQGQSLDIHPWTSGLVTESAACGAEDNRFHLPNSWAGTRLQATEAVAWENYFWKAEDPSSLQTYYPWAGKRHAVSFKGCHCLAQHKLSVAWPPTLSHTHLSSSTCLSHLPTLLLQGCGVATKDYQISSWSSQLKITYCVSWTPEFLSVQPHVLILLCQSHPMLE